MSHCLTHDREDACKVGDLVPRRDERRGHDGDSSLLQEVKDISISFICIRRQPPTDCYDKAHNICLPESLKDEGDFFEEVGELSEHVNISFLPIS